MNLISFFKNRDNKDFAEEVLNRLVSTSYDANKVSVFLFDNIKETQGDYQGFLSTLSLENKAYVKELIQESTVSGDPFSYIIPVEYAKYITIYGFPVGSIYSVFTFPQEKNIFLEESPLFGLPFPIWATNQKGELLYANKIYEDVFSEIVPVTEDISLPYKGNIQYYKRQKIQLPPTAPFHLYYAQEVTQTRQLQKTVHSLQETQKEFIASVPVAAIYFDSNRQIKEYNQYFLNLWGISPSVMETIPSHAVWLDYLQSKRLLPEKRDMKPWRQKQFSLYEQMEGMYAERWDLPNKTILNLKAHAYKTGGVLMFFEDITGTISMETEYIKTSKNLQEALDVMQEDIALFNHSYRLVAFNQKMYSKAQEKLYPDMSFSAFSASFEQGSIFQEFCSRAQEKLHTANMVLEQKLPKGDKHYHLKYERLDNGDVLITFQDITSQVNYEKTLKDKSDALEELNHIRAMLFKQISSELRVPMTAISGLSDMLETELLGNLNRKQKEYIQDIKNSSLKILSFVDNLMDIASLENAANSDHFSYHDIRDIMNDILVTLAKRLKEKELSIHYNSPDQSIKFLCDYTSFRQSILQLIYNAITASPQKEKIILEIDVGEKYISLSVINKGKGMEPSVLKILQNGHFIPNGYGLRYVKRVCDYHGFLLNFESGKNIGTKAQLLFPHEKS